MHNTDLEASAKDIVGLGRQQLAKLKEHNKAKLEKASGWKRVPNTRTKTVRKTGK
jgi:hypothetical protein